MGHFTCKRVVTFLLVKEKLLDFAIVVPIRYIMGRKGRGMMPASMMALLIVTMIQRRKSSGFT